MTEQKRNSFIPSKKILQKILNSFDQKQALIFVALFLVLIISAISMLGKINKKFLTYLPEFGGTLDEGVVGTPRFVNPVLAVSETDRDLTELIYSGLMKKNPDGTLTTDMAESYTVSPDGLVYTFKIKENAKFHDKTPLTASDVIFTIEKIRDSLIKSPLQAVWNGVSVSKDETDSGTVVFRLAEPYASFLESATLGILPSHIWSAFDAGEFNLAEQNLEAVGSGPYKLRGIDQKKNNLVEEFQLAAFNDYAGTRPFIKYINFKFYKNETEALKAFRKGRVDQISSVSPKAAKELADAGFNPTTSPLSRVFGIFMNPNQNEILRDKEIVKALDLAISRNSIISEVLYGFGEPLTSPVPGSISGRDTTIVETEDAAAEILEAERILDERGWKKNDTGVRTKDGKMLQFSISTADVGELRHTAEIIKRDLATIGVTVNIKVFETGILNQNIIRPREYEALLFGQVIRNASDLFAFWHSSQRNDPGLNISVYTNSKVDNLLEELVGATDVAERDAKIREFEEEIKRDRPAIFLYSPEFIYIKSDKVKSVEIDHITSISERFLGINNWYIRTDTVWTFLQKQEAQEQNQ